MTDTGLAYVGKVIALDPIPDADFIVSATVVCGQGGKWQGVVKKDEFNIGGYCIVFLPDSLLPPSEEYSFMEKRGWRVRMCRFKGAPSEVLILKPPQALHGGVGLDITMPLGVRKYYKPVPVNLEGKVIGDFPSFIPKTDEPNYQRVQKQIDMLIGHPYYITEKCDGSSTTAYKQDGELYVASRNWMLAYDENNGYWKVAEKYKLRELLPEGVALQWETCGPKIQRNNHKLKEVDGYAFSAYYITHKRYLDYDEFIKLCDHLKFPRARRIQEGSSFDGNMNQMRILSEDQYENGHIREGIVIRSQSNLLGHQPISFKVINLEYET